MATITKKELIGRITKNTQAKRLLVQAAIRNFLDEIISELGKGNRLEFRGFGVFEVKEQAARTAQNPKTLEKIQVPSRRRVKFKMGRVMSEKLNAKGAEQ